MKQRRPDDVIRCSADADPMSKTIIGPMKLSVIGPMKHPSRARHRADDVVLVGLLQDGRQIACVIVPGHRCLQPR